MFLANASVSYDTREAFSKLSDEDKAEFYRRLPKYAPKDSADPLSEPAWWSGDDSLVDETDCQWLTEHGFTVNIKRLKGLTGVGGYSLSSPEHVADMSGRNAVHIHVPNIALQSYDEVTNLDDACTDELQHHLDDGWRILAVCPPNNTRRPDYILGRKK